MVAEDKKIEKDELYAQMTGGQPPSNLRELTEDAHTRIHPPKGIPSIDIGELFHY